MTAYAGPAVVSSGLVLNLDAGNVKSYPGSGTTWTDLTGNANNGTLVSGPTYSSSNGGAITFSGLGDYVTCPSAPSYNFGTGDFTFEMWLNQGTAGGSYGHLFSLPDQNTFTWKTYFDGTLNQVYFYSPSFRSDGVGGIPCTTANDWVITTGTWNYLVFVRQSAVAYGYKNGILKGTKSGFTTSFSSQILYLGKGYGGEYRAKSVSAARIYNRALSADEVTQNFNALRGRYGL